MALVIEPYSFKNIQHGHSPLPLRCKTWKKYWCDRSGEEWPRFCSARRCDREADGSAHVFVDCEEDEEYIIPTCGFHRNHSEKYFQKTNRNVIAVYIDRDKIMKELLDNLNTM